MATALTCSWYHILRRPYPSQNRPLPLSLSFFKPISFSPSHRRFIQHPTIPKLPLSIHPIHPLPFHTSQFPSLHKSSLRDNPAKAENDDDIEEEEEEDDDVGYDELENERGELVVMGKVPSLTVKEKKDLASYAHSLGDKLKSQLVGKSGVTPNLVSSFNETLEANELLKIKVHRTCPGELDDVIKQLEVATGSVAVGQIGRTVIVYKPSLKKLQVEEKRKQASRTFVRKEWKVKTLYLKKERGLGRPGRGRTGSRRLS